MPMLECPHCKAKLKRVLEFATRFDYLEYYEEECCYYWPDRGTDDLDTNRAGWEPNYSRITYCCPLCFLIIPEDLVEPVIGRLDFKEPIEELEADHDDKFKEFNKMCDDTNADAVLIHHPEVLGDTYYEIVRNLNRLADSGKILSIIPNEKR